MPPATFRVLSIETGFNPFQKNISKKSAIFPHRLKAVTIDTARNIRMLSIETGFNPFQKKVSKKLPFFPPGKTGGY